MSPVLSAGLVITCVKILLFPSYHSTDLEVHRNWLAVTSSLPLDQWYYNEDSKWTLDYPPLFAYFEFLLSIPATMLDPNITQLHSLDYASDTCVTFQRMTVVASDLILILATNTYVTTLRDKLKSRTLALSLLVVCNSGLLLVDHIHFQYNGMLLGILVFSLVAMKKGYFITSAALFTVLLFSKHIFVYLAPAYFVFLLTHYCFHTKHITHSFVTIATLRILALSLTVLSVTLLSLLSFLSHLPQLISRLFPFKRGLTHAYWAPNIWALYNTADTVLTRLVLSESGSNLTRGLVGEGSHLYLPSVSPLVTLVCTIVAMLPGIIIGMRANRSSNPFLTFVTSLTLCGFASFMFGWHVHEKAILMVIVPFTLVAVEQPAVTPIYSLLSCVGVFSLFPLVNQLREAPIKICLLLLNYIFCLKTLPKCHSGVTQLTRLENAYLSGLIPLSCLEIFGGFLSRYQFLPLMMTSLYCAVGNVYVWIRMVLLAFQLYGQ